MLVRENGDGSACGDDNKSIPSVGKVNEQENGPGVACLPADCNTGDADPVEPTRQSRHSRLGLQYFGASVRVAMKLMTPVQ